MKKRNNVSWIFLFKLDNLISCFSSVFQHNSDLWSACHHCHTFWIWKTSVTFLTGFSCWNENRAPSSWVGLPRPPSRLTLQRIFVILLSLLGSSLGCCICSLLFLAALSVTKQLFFDQNNFSWKQWYVWNYYVKQSLVLLQYQTIRCVIRRNKVQNHFKYIYSSPPDKKNKTQDLSATCPAHVMFAESDCVLWPDLTVVK